MQKLLLMITVCLIFGCSTQNPNLNSNNNNSNNNNVPYSYSSGPNLTDANGNVYPSIVTSCGQTWTTKNLAVSRYRNGEEIPQVTDAFQWENCSYGAWCWYNNDSATYWQYGKLYNSFAMKDYRGIAPQGWHVPTDGEWNKLIKCIDFSADTTCIACVQSETSGGALKESGLSHWLSPNTGASNSSGFSALPGGERENDGTFNLIGSFGVWGVSAFTSTGDDWVRRLYFQTANMPAGSGKYIRGGFSIRLVKD